MNTTTKDKKIDLSIIIVSYNTHDLTLQTLNSVILDLKKSRLTDTTEVIVVDNNSKDDSVAEIKKLIQKEKTISLTVLPQKKNLGFGKANNLALEKATGQLIFFLNSDTIVKPNALSYLKAAFSDHKLSQPTADLSSYPHKLDRLGILAATLLNQDQTLQPQGGSFPSLWSLFFHMTMLDDLPVIGSLFPSTQHTGYRTNQTLHKQTDQPRSSHLHQQDWVGATAMMVRRETLAQIGPFDQNIFMYGEDVELCLRAKNHHWDVAIHPGSFVIHLGSASSSSKNAIIGELTGWLYIWSKHKPDWQVPIAKELLQLGARLRVLLFGTILRDQMKASIYQAALAKLKSA